MVNKLMGTSRIVASMERLPPSSRHHQRSPEAKLDDEQGNRRRIAPPNLDETGAAGSGAAGPRPRASPSSTPRQEGTGATDSPTGRQEAVENKLIMYDIAARELAGRIENRRQQLATIHTTGAGRPVVPSFPYGLSGNAFNLGSTMPGTNTAPEAIRYYQDPRMSALELASLRRQRDLSLLPPGPYSASTTGVRGIVSKGSPSLGSSSIATMAQDRDACASAVAQMKSGNAASGGEGPSSDAPSVILEEIARQRPKNCGGVTELFPQKLHRMLEEAEKQGLEDIVSFFPHGKSFCIHKPSRFVSEVMPKYFKGTRITSFQRQLNLYGFRRINYGPEHGGYFHEFFIKGRPELCYRIKRVPIKGAEAMKGGGAGGPISGPHHGGLLSSFDHGAALGAQFPGDYSSLASALGGPSPGIAGFFDGGAKATDFAGHRGTDPALSLSLMPGLRNAGAADLQISSASYPMLERQRLIDAALARSAMARADDSLGAGLASPAANLSFLDSLHAYHSAGGGSFGGLAAFDSPAPAATHPSAAAMLEATAARRVADIASRHHHAQEGRATGTTEDHRNGRRRDENS